MSRGGTRVAVTGATGHLGANLVRTLLDAGFTVRALYRTSATLTALDCLDVETIQADVLDPASLEEAFSSVDAVINLAGVISIDGDPHGHVMRTNVEGPRNVARTCHRLGVRKLVHVSSIHAFKYRAADAVVDETHPLADADCFIYDRSKALGEAEVLSAASEGLDVTILNPTGVIGPHDFFGSRAGQMLTGLFSGKLPAVIDGGFDWVDARDVAEAAIAAMEKGRRTERYIVSGHWVSIADLAEQCASIAGILEWKSRYPLPVWSALAGLPFLKGWSRLTGTPPLYTYESLMILKHSNRNCSHDKAAREFDYRPRPIAVSLRDIYHWHRTASKT